MRQISLNHFEHPSETRCRSSTLGYASVQMMLSQLFRASFRRSLSLAVPLAMPRLKRRFLSSFEPGSQARCRSQYPWLFLGSSDDPSARLSLVQTLALTRSAFHYALVKMMLFQLSGLVQFLAVAHDVPVAPPRSEIFLVSLLSLDVPLALPRMQ